MALGGRFRSDPLFLTPLLPLPMLRTTTASTLLAALALFAAPVLAQEQDGCLQADPCPIEVTVDEEGFSGEVGWTVTRGDWYRLVVLNADLEGREHHLRLMDMGVEMHVPADNQAESPPILFDRTGQFALMDRPSEDTVWITVSEFDAVAVDNSTATDTGSTTGAGGDPTGDADSPMLPLLLLGAVLVLLAVRRR